VAGIGMVEALWGITPIREAFHDIWILRLVGDFS
jgi:hypothetical protein